VAKTRASPGMWVSNIADQYPFEAMHGDSFEVIGRGSKIKLRTDLLIDQQRPGSGGATFVPMMKSADFGNRNDFANRLHRSRIR
jgi:hypothetical protein